VGERTVELNRVSETLRRQIVEWQRAEEELRTLSRAVEHSPSTVVITDPQGTIKYVNPRFTELTGYCPEEVLGQTPRLLQSGEHSSRFYKELWDTITAGMDWRGEFINRKKNGELYWELASISPVRDADGVITDFVKVAEDITERKRAEEAQHQRVEELSTLNRIAHMLAMVTDLPEALESVAETVTHLFGAHETTFTVWDASRAELKILAQFRRNCPSPDAVGQVFPLSDVSAAREVLEQDRTLAIPDAQSTLLSGLVTERIHDPNLRYLMIVPLRSRGSVVGVMCVGTDQANRVFSSDELTLAETIAGDIAAAIDSVGLFDEEQRHRQIAESLHEIATVLTGTLDQKTVLTTILEQLGRVMRYDGACISLLEGEDLVLAQAIGVSTSYLGHRIPLAGETPPVLVFKNGQAQVITDTATYPGWDRWAGSDTIRSWMGAPLGVGDTMFGLLTVDACEVAVYAEEDVYLLQTFASQAATAINNARLYEHAVAARERLAVLNRASQAISAASPDPQQIYSEIHRAANRLVPCDALIITLIDQAGQEAEDVYLAGESGRWPGRRYPLLPKTLAAYMLRRGQSVRFEDLRALPEDEIDLEMYGELMGARSGLAVPLRGRERLLGLLLVQSKAHGAYVDADQGLLELLAAHGAIALENAWLHEQAQVVAADAERQRLARELHDSVTQSLYSLTLLANGWGAMAEQGRLENPANCFSQLGGVGQQALKEMRLLIHQLRPPILEEVGLVGALQQRLDVVEQRVSVDTRLLTRGKVDDIPRVVEEHLFHIAQEALNNALRHSDATAITVSICEEKGHIILAVEDYGTGFDPTTASAGMGLTNIRDRAEVLGGEVLISSTPGAGSRVEVRVSLRPDGEV